MDACGTGTVLHIRQEIFKVNKLFAYLYDIITFEIYDMFKREHT